MPYGNPMNGTGYYATASPIPRASALNLVFANGINASITKKVKLEAGGKRSSSEDDDDIKSKSRTTQAIKLFSALKTPLEVAIALDLPADQVQAIYQEYCKLDGMYRLAQRALRSCHSASLLFLLSSSSISHIIS